MSTLHRALYPVKRRLRHGRAIRGAALGLIIGGTLGLGVMILSFFVPMEDKTLLFAGLVLLSLLLGTLVGVLVPVKDEQAAQAADRQGLKERAQTALSLAGDSPMERLQRQDALDALGSFDSRLIPLPRPRRALIAGCALILAAGLTMLVPNPQNEMILKKQALEEMLEEALRQAEQEEKGEKSLNEKQRQELRRLTEEMKKALETARNPMDALLAVDEGEKRMEKLRETMAGETMDALARALEAQGLSELKEALQSGDNQAVEEALQNAEASQMESVAAMMEGDMQSLMNAVAQMISSGNFAAAAQQLIAAPLMSADMQLAGLTGLLGALRAQAGGTGMSAAMGKGDETGSAGGKGSTNEDVGYKEESGLMAGGARDPRYKEGQFESIYDPTRLNASQTEAAAASPRGEGQSAQMQLGPGVGTLAGSVPYNQVVEEYAAAAAQAADSQSLTRREQQWVDEYFAALTAQ